MDINQQKLDTFVKNYWNYYVDLDHQMMSTRKYVEFSESNYSTYSVEFLKLYQAVCSEIDVVGKMLVSELNPEFRIDGSSTNILKWWYGIQDWYSNWKKKAVKFRRQYELQPWENFKVEYVADKNDKMYPRVIQTEGYKVPTWWSAYNKVKHERTSIDKSTQASNFEKANLINLSNAFSALYLLEKNYILMFGDMTSSYSITNSALFERDIPVFFTKDNELFCTYEYE